jgi:SAM-dependent methyltransferase
MTFKDHFSSHANVYAESRPDYPAALFAYLADLCSTRELVWDCATGNGQAAQALASYFTRVVATDASAAQIEAARPGANIEYAVAPAEAVPLTACSVDMVTVAQALHWFDIDAFFASVRRVLKPGGVLAVWSYGLTRITPAVDQVIAELYDGVLGDYWPPERKLVERGYADIQLPFEALTPPPFEMRRNWSLDQLLAYLNSWSSTQRYLRQHGNNPLALVQSELQSAWGSDRVLPVIWPLTVKLCRRPGDDG